MESVVQHGHEEGLDVQLHVVEDLHFRNRYWHTSDMWLVWVVWTDFLT